MAVTGAEVVYACKRANQWNTPVAVGVGDGIKGLPWSGDPDTPVLVDDSLGTFFATDATPGQTKLEKTFTSYARYNDKVLLTMLAAFFGTAGVPAAHAGSAAAKDHVLKLAKKVDGVFFTLCALAGDAMVEEVPSWKVAKLVITWETGKAVTFAFSGPANDLVDNSVVNTTGTFNNVTILETANRAYMGQTVFRMNDQADGALDAGDKIGPSKAVLTLARNAKGEYGSYVDADAGRELIDEPTNNGAFTGSLELTYPRTKDGSGRRKVKTNTPQKGDIFMTGPVIDSGVPFSIGFQLPNLTPSKSVNPHQQGNIGETRSYEVIGAVAAPTGMPGNTDPCRCLLTNKIATDLLA